MSPSQAMRPSLWIPSGLAAVLCLCLSGCDSSSPGPDAGPEAGRPNPSTLPHIVLIMADDMGYGDVAAFNPDSKIETPHIDQLAAEGLRFTDAHAPGAVCTPTRYGLLTGRYPFRNTREWGEGLIEDGRLTLAQLLRDAGYATSMVGKWHLSFEGGGGNGSGGPLRRGPVDRGFDTYFGIPASLDIPPYFYVEDDHAVAPATGWIDDGPTSAWGQGAFWRAGQIAEGFDHAEVLPRFEQEAVARIEEHAAGAGEEGTPLFLYLALAAPHTPWLPDDVHRGTSEAGEYGDFVTMVDATVGRVLEALEESGMAEDALVIFTSDNGPYWLDVDRRTFGHDSAGGLRGMKGDAWEAGHRVPFVARWPGHVPAGTETGALLCLTDLLATFASLTEAGALPEDAGEDSLDQLPVLLDPDGPPAREDLIVLSSANVKVMRQGKWKLIPQLGSGGFSQPDRVEPGPGDPAGQLYDLEADLAERDNRYAAEPGRVRELTDLLDAQVAAGRSR